MFQRTQEQIMQAWKNNVPCLVSVVCTTYNQEEYISKAIESFLFQETDFPFEIIIHDDFSTDKTPGIIQEYYTRYPQIIKPIFQQENQYSKGVFRPFLYAAGYAVGKYVALCEGDDFWINERKLQIQIEAMQRHPEVDFSFHPAYLMHKGECMNKPSWDFGVEQLFYPDSILKYIGSFAPTASYIINREILVKLPSWLFDAPVGDFFLEMYGAKRGGALFVNIPMSIYRENSLNSWSATISQNYPLRLKHLEKMLSSLQLLKKDFSNYLRAFKKKEAVLYFAMSNCYLQIGDNLHFRENIEKSISSYSFFSPKQRLAYILRCMPILLMFLSKIDPDFYFFSKRKT